MTGTLVVTNDFPPRPGGIQAFVHALCRGLGDEVAVYAPAWRGAADFDREQPFPVVRHPTSLMLPTPGVLGRARRAAREHKCASVLYGAAAPLGLLTRGLRAAGVGRAVALTHGHETGWARLPGARALLRRIGDDVDVVTYVGEYTRGRIAPALSDAAAARMAWLAPGVDLDAFRPDAGGAAMRDRLGLADRPVVVCVSRLVPRKGQDTLIRAWPAVRRAVPDATLLLVGGGPSRDRLRRLADATGVADAVVFTGSVPWRELPAHFDAGDVFAMPCRTRAGGLDVEALGIVFLEAAACGLPVVAGDSGGSRDAVRDGETGYVVDGRSPDTVAERLVALLRDRELAAAMGARGRAWVEREWGWDRVVARLRELLRVPQA
ncbi:MAG: glycosyltransferase family 4 protein [Acidothermales bacterium]|nr:glycosyltransferase family 4 protein [Acidothermales bacterium]